LNFEPAEGMKRQSFAYLRIIVKNGVVFPVITKLNQMLIPVFQLLNINKTIQNSSFYIQNYPVSCLQIPESQISILNTDSFAFILVMRFLTRT